MKSVSAILPVVICLSSGENELLLDLQTQDLGSAAVLSLHTLCCLSSHLNTECIYVLFKINNVYPGM